MPWGAGPTAPFDLEAHLISELPSLLPGVQVDIDMQGYTSGKRVVVDLVGSFPLEGGRRQARVNFQAVASNKADAWDLAALLVSQLGPLSATGRVTSAQVNQGPTPLPSGYADNGDPARYFLAVDFTTVDL